MASSSARRNGSVVWVTTGPPSLLVATLLHHARGAFPLVIDYRDVWTDAPSLKRNKAWLTRWLMRRFEHAVLRRANLVTTVSAAWVSLFRGKGAARCVEISNGFDPEDRPDHLECRTPWENDVHRPFLAYAGRLHSGRRNARALSRLFDHVPETHEVHYFGGDREFFVEIAAKLGSRARCRGLIPLNELLGILSQASGLLAVGGRGDSWEARGAIPAKVYEYMLTERPILYLGDAEHEASRRIALYPRGFVAAADGSEEDFAASVRAFLKMSEDHKPLRPAERKALEDRWGYPQLAARLAEALASLEARP
jgi:hypothetical protein